MSGANPKGKADSLKLPQIDSRTYHGLNPAPSNKSTAHGSFLPSLYSEQPKVLCIVKLLLVMILTACLYSTISNYNNYIGSYIASYMSRTYTWSLMYLGIGCNYMCIVFFFCQLICFSLSSLSILFTLDCLGDIPTPHADTTPSLNHFDHRT